MLKLTITPHATGDVYEGLFKDNMRHGYGVLKSKGGRVYYGRWKRNKLVQNSRSNNSCVSIAAACTFWE